MKYLNLKKVMLLLSLFGSSQYAGATLLVEQYNDFWSTDVNQLINYANTHDASSTAEVSVIDFTDDPFGFAGEIAGSNPWPSAAEVGATGTGHELNQTFFARITGDFYVPTADTYTFQTYNDDGVFLYVDGLLTINDPNLHPEIKFQGTQALDMGVHSVELYFFENGGEASLEFTLADSSNIFTHFNNPPNQVPQAANVPEPGTFMLMAAGLLGFARLNKKYSRA